MKILEEEIERGELKDAENVLEGGMVKAVVDVDREIIGVDEHAPGVREGQRSLVFCSPWGRKESDMTE